MTTTTTTTHLLRLSWVIGLLFLADTAKAQELEQCSICATGEVVTNGDVVLPAFSVFLPASVTCDELEDLAQAATFTAGQCALLTSPVSGVSTTWYVKL